MPAKRQLSVEKIVEAAVDLARESGLDAVAIRPLARRMGVAPMSLYRHIANHEELVRATVDAIGAEVEIIPRPDLPWEEELQSHFRAIRSVLQRYPGTAEWLITHSIAGPNAFRMANTISGALLRAGFASAEAATAMFGLLTWVFARCVIDDRNGFRSRPGGKYADSFDARERERYPSAAAIADEAAGAGPDDMFERGIELMLEGIKHRWSRAACDAPNAREGNEP